MTSKLSFAAALLGAALALSGCVVAAPARPGCYWVPAHYGPNGGFIPAHCRR